MTCRNFLRRPLPAIAFLLLIGLVFLLRGTPTESSPKAAAAKAPATQFECRWADSPIVLDGKGDDAAWKNAQVIDHFYVPWLGDKARPAKTKTKAKLLWDREYLYFLADMEDVCDRVAILHQGELRALGRLETLLADDRRTQILTGPLAPQTVEAVTRVIRQHEGADAPVAVGHPSTRLEEFFIRTVAKEGAERR